MPRRARVVAIGCPHHITQRGNGRRDIFLTDHLKEVYLDLLRKEAHRHRLLVLGYCIMTNHVHLVAIPETENSMAYTLRRAHGRFAQYWNTELESIGHMWQNRFYSCPVEPTRIFPVLRYVELNPVRAGMVRAPADYPWSSAAAHIDGEDGSGLLDMSWWREQRAASLWASELSIHPDLNEVAAIRQATFSGRPFAAVEFVDRLESILKVSLKQRQPGRPKKAQAASGK